MVLTIRHTKRLALVLAAGLLLAANGQKPDAVKEEMAKFQGAWKAVSIERNGEKAIDDDDALKQLTLTVKGDTRTITAGDETVSVGTFKLDPSQKPKAIDITVSKGPLEGKPLRGIYEIDGDTHKICLALEGDERPKEFTSKAGSGHLLQVFRRAKADK